MKPGDVFLSRTEVRRFACPACGAQPDERCVGARDKPRESNHAERVLVAETAHETAHEARNAQ